MWMGPGTQTTHIHTYTYVCTYTFTHKHPFPPSSVGRRMCSVRGAWRKRAAMAGDTIPALGLCVYTM